MIKIDKLPLPPTSNKQYAIIRGRYVKTADSRKFDHDCENWAFIYRTRIDRIKSSLGLLIDNGKQLSVYCIYVFHRNRIFTKKGTLKKVDTSNRNKALHDNLARILGIDDSLFIYTPSERVYCDDPKDEQTIVVISEYQIRSFNDL